MFMDKNENPVEPVKTSPVVKMALIICGGAIVLVGLLSWIFEYIKTLQY
jgi:hypothetical protein